VLPFRRATITTRIYQVGPEGLDVNSMGDIDLRTLRRNTSLTLPLERESELRVIDDALDESRSEGQVVVIEGPMGIGKSRLIEAAQLRASERQMDVVHARAGELERDYAFGLVLRMFEHRLRRADSVERHRLLKGRAALAAPLLLEPVETHQPAAATDEFALLHGLYWCVVNLSEHRPVALLVDDVQWCDELSLRFLIYLAQRIEDLRVALVIGINTGDPAAASTLITHLSAAATHRLRPAELSLVAVRRLFESEDLLWVGDDLIRTSWDTTGGNPLLLTGLIAAIKESPAHWANADASDVTAFAPHSIRRQLMVRVAGLGDQAVALVSACSVLGDDALIQDAASLAALSAREAAAMAERLVAGGILRGTDHISFTHPMVRSAVYGELAPGERSRIHVTAAELLYREGAAADEVATHLLAGAPIGDSWAREALHEGARLAARKGAPATAVRYLRRALQVCAPEDRSADLLIDLGLLEAAAGFTTSLTRFEKALTIIADPAEQDRAMYALGQTLYRYGQHKEAARIFRRGAELFSKRDRQLSRRFEGAYICASQFVASLHLSAMERLEALAHNGLSEEPPTVTDRVLQANLAVHRAGTRPHAGNHAQLALDALQDGALLLAETSDSMALNIAIAGLIFCGRLAEAEAAVETVLADARRRGDALAFAEASMMRAMVTHARGDIVNAMVDAQTAIDGMERGWQGLIPIPQALLALCLIERGDFPAADEVLRKVESILPSPDTSYLNAWFHWARGYLALARGDPRAACTSLLEIGDDLKPYGRISPAIAPWRSLAGLALAQIGDGVRALALIDEEIELSRSFGLQAQLGAGLRARARLLSTDSAIACLQEARAALEDAAAPLEQARTLHDLGRILRHAGQRTACREPLRRSLDLAHRCGATALEAQCRKELRASGAKPRRSAISGVESLTPTERRIAGLAVQGKTNRGIAEALFLTRNTVDWHLRNVYRKLEVRSRETLASRLRSREDRFDESP